MNTLQAVFKKLLHSNSYNQALSVETQTKSQAPSSTTTLQLTPARQPRKGSKLNSSNHNFLPLTNLPGIGRHTPSALKRYGITSIQQFAQFEEQEIIALLGRSGVQLLTTAKKICQTQFA